MSKIIIKSVVKLKMFFSLIFIQEIARTVWYAFLVLYIIKSGWNLSDYSFIKSLSLLLILAFEIPSGFLSDKFGRKKVYQFSLFAFAISSLLFLFLLENKYLVFPAEIIYALGFAACSGTLKSSKINEIKDNDPSLLNNYFYDLKIIQLTSRTIGASVGAFLFYFTTFNPFYLSLPLFVIAIIISFFYVDYQPNISNRERHKNHFKFNIKELIKNKSFWLILITWYSITISIALVFNWWQPIFKKSSTEYKYILLFAFLAFNIFAITGALIAKKNYFKFNVTTRLIIGISFSAIPIILTFFVGYGYVTIGCFVICSLGRGMLQPTLSPFLQKEIPNKIRGFTTSFISSFSSLIMMSVLAIGGLLLKFKIDMLLVLLIFNSIYLLIFCIFAYLYFRHNKVEVKEGTIQVEEKGEKVSDMTEDKKETK